MLQHAWFEYKPWHPKKFYRSSAVTGPLFHLQRTLTHNRRLKILAAVVDSAAWGIVTFLIAMAVLIGFRQPAGIAAVVAALAGYFSWRRPSTEAEVATDLDRRHGLAELLSSAWATRDSDEPWATSLRSIADAKAATLPPLPWPGRWSVRRSACGLAIAIVALLWTQLVPSNVAQAELNRAADAAGRSDSRSADPLHVANAHQRAADTAKSETRLPSEHDSAAKGQSSSEPAQSAANDANGDGQADSKQTSSIELHSSAKSVTDPSGIAGGNRTAEGTAARSTATSVVQSQPGGLAEGGIMPSEAPSNPSTAVRPAAPPPEGYRDLISDFFAR